MNDIKHPPAILACSCVFPSGPGIALADIAVRNQMSLVDKHPFFADRCGAPVKGSFFADPDTRFDLARWRKLARLALDQLMTALGRQRTGDGLPRRVRCKLWVVLPSDESHRLGSAAGMAIWDALDHPDVENDGGEIVFGGHAAGIRALARAGAALDADPDAVAIVLGVDSYFNSERLFLLEHGRLLHGAHQPYCGGSRTNPYGRIPGEGAAAVALHEGEHASGSSWARLSALATAREPNTHSVDQPCIGRGMTEAALAALRQTPGAAAGIAHLFTDLNGEPYRADEFGFTVQRLSKALAPGWQRHTPALASADLGSASALAHIAVAAFRLKRDPGCGRHLILAGSDDALRGAAILDAIRHPSLY